MGQSGFKLYSPPPRDEALQRAELPHGAHGATHAALGPDAAAQVDPFESKL